jgi:hypothetical protein
MLYSTSISAPGISPEIVSYNANAVKNYNATCSLVHSGNIFFFFEEMLYSTTTSTPGVNPAIMSYNANDVKYYNATSSPVHFGNNFFLH